MSDDGKHSTSTSRASASRAAISDEVWDEAAAEWVNTSLRNSVMSQAPTEAWNHVIGELPKLRKILESKI